MFIFRCNITGNVTLGWQGLPRLFKWCSATPPCVEGCTTSRFSTRKAVQARTLPPQNVTFYARTPPSYIRTPPGGEGGASLQPPPVACRAFLGQSRPNLTQRTPWGSTGWPGHAWVGRCGVRLQRHLVVGVVGGGGGRGGHGHHHRFSM